MNDPRRPAATPAPPTAEPVSSPRAAIATDWESVALGRVAGRMDALTRADDDTSATGRLQAFGWESAALANLRRRLRRPDEG